MSETLFMTGREPELSVAELEAVASQWQAKVIDAQAFGVLLRSESALPARAIDRLGGSIKQVSVLECFDKNKPLIEVVKTQCSADWVQQQFPEGRIEYGVSVYGWSKKQRADVQHHFLGLKKELRTEDRAVRFVSSKEPQLSAVTIHRNGLDKRGKEFVFFESSESIVLGVTTAVQDYQAYAVRDFGRPASNPKSGMLPPKVSQMMLNIAKVQPNDILLDPFCGSGTILQEGLLLGVQEVHGSDSNGKAVQDSQENIRWLMKEYPKIQATVEITKHDAAETRVKPTVIVTEPYLGKPLRGNEPHNFILQQANDLEKLYFKAAQNWARSMKPGARLVMIWPEFVTGPNETIVLDTEARFAELGFEPEPILTETSAKILNRGERFILTYGRDDARVRRQIRKWVYKA